MGINLKNVIDELGIAIEKTFWMNSEKVHASITLFLDAPNGDGNLSKHLINHDIKLLGEVLDKEWGFYYDDDETEDWELYYRRKKITKNFSTVNDALSWLFETEKKIWATIIAVIYEKYYSNNIKKISEKTIVLKEEDLS